MARGGAIGIVIALVVAVGCSSSDKTASPPTTSASASASASPSSSSSSSASSESSGVLIGDDDATRVQYVLATPDGVTVRYTIPAPEDNPVVQRVNQFHRDTGETRPYRLILAEVDNQSSKLFETGDLEVTENDGDKVHFIEAWLFTSQWHRNVRDQRDSPVWQEGFDIQNDLVARGLVEPGTADVTVLAAEDYLKSVRSATARDRSEEMVPLTRVA